MKIIMMIRTCTKFHHLRADEDDDDELKNTKSLFAILFVVIYSAHPHHHPRRHHHHHHHHDQNDHLDSPKGGGPSARIARSFRAISREDIVVGPEHHHDIMTIGIRFMIMIMWMMKINPDHG